MKKIICVVLVIAALAGLVMLISKAFAPTFNEEDFEIKSHRVQAGEGIDNLYYKYCSQDVDLFEYREKIKELNNMTNSMLYEGDKIKVYVYVGN